MHRGEAPGQGRDSSGWDLQQVSSSEKAVPGSAGVFWWDKRRGFITMGLRPAN